MLRHNHPASPERPTPPSGTLPRLVRGGLATLMISGALLTALPGLTGLASAAPGCAEKASLWMTAGSGGSQVLRQTDTNGNLLRTVPFPGADNTAQAAITFSADGQTMYSVTSGSDQLQTVLPYTGEVQKTVTITGPAAGKRLFGLTSQPDGSLYATDNDKTLYRIDPATGVSTVVATLPDSYKDIQDGGEAVRLPDGDILTLTQDDHFVRIHPDGTATQLGFIPEVHMKGMTQIGDTIYVAKSDVGSDNPGGGNGSGVNGFYTVPIATIPTAAGAAVPSSLQGLHPAFAGSTDLASVQDSGSCHHDQTLDSSMSLKKTAAAPVDANGDGSIDAGDTIAYSFAVENTGNMPLKSIAVNDPKVGNVACPATTLDYKKSMTCTASYTITQADVTAGKVDNSATASSKDAAGVDANAPASTTSTPIVNDPKLTLTKSAKVDDVDKDGATGAGDTIDYSFAVKNEGAGAASQVKVDDPKLANVNCPQTTLAAGASMTCTGSYTVTQADVDAGTVDNSATAQGTSSTGKVVTSESSSTSTPTSQVSSLSMTKEVSENTDENGNELLDAGDQLSYDFKVTNTGTTTLDQVKVDDAKIGSVTCPAGQLAPGATVTCTSDAPYTVTQDEVDAGSVDNSATASAVDPSGKSVNLAQAATTSTPTGTAYSLVLDKRVGSIDDVDHNGRRDPGDKINYVFEVANTGTVSMSKIAVDDPTLGAVTCPADRLAPGASIECAGDEPHVITDGDGTKGEVANVATASGEAADGHVTVSAPSRIVVRDISRKAGPAGAHGSRGHGSVLPNTGGPNEWLLVTGAGAIASGLGLLMIGARRRRDATS